MVIDRKVIFEADQVKVWGLLTESAWTRKYMFGCSLISDWKLGSPVLWKGPNQEGIETLFVQGELLHWEPQQKMSITMFDPNMGLQDLPKNYVKLTYELETVPGGTQLRIIQGDFSKSDNGEQRFAESKAGWDMVLPVMQKLVSQEINPAS